MGIRTTSMDSGQAKGELYISQKHMNISNAVHGGCIFSLADTIGGSAASSYGDSVVTVSGNINYLTPAIGSKKIVAAANAIKKGKRITVCDVEISDEKGTILAKGTFTYYIRGKLTE